MSELSKESFSSCRQLQCLEDFVIKKHIVQGGTVLTVRKHHVKSCYLLKLVAVSFHLSNSFERSSKRV